MDLSAVQSWLGVLDRTMSIAAVAVTWWLIRSRATKDALGGLATKEEVAAMAKRLDAIEPEVDGLGTRLQNVEKDVQALPNITDVHELKISIEQLKMSIAVLTEKLNPVAGIANRMQDWMLEHGK